MKRILLLLVITVMLATASLVSADSPASKKIRIAAFNFYPTLFQDKNGSVQGFYVDFLNEIAKREGWTIEYIYGNWADGLARIKSGEVDVVTNVALTAERTQFMDYGKVPLLTVWAELYAPNGSPIDSIRDVKNKKIALMKGDFNAANFKNLVEKFGIPCTYVEYGNFEEVFKSIAARQVDAGIVNNTFGTAKQSEYNLKSTGIIFNPFDIFFTVAKGKNSAILATLDHYLEEWRKNESSPYHQARERWSHKSASTIRVVHPWLKKAVVISGILLCIAVGFVILLRIQVRRKTAEIQKYTDELHLATRQLEDEVAERQVAQEALQEQTVLLEEEIEEHRRVEDELRESKSKFQAFYELGLVGLTITSPEKGWLNINDCLCTMLGYSEAELRELTWAQLTHPDDLAADIEQFDRIIIGEIDGYELDKRFLTRSGEIIFTKLVVRCVRRPDRSVDFIVAMVQDITKSKQIENELRDAEWKFRALFNNGPIGVAYHSMIYDESGTPVDYRFIDANDNYLKLTGVDPRGKTVTQAFPGIEKDPFDWIGVFGRVAKSGETVHFQQYFQSNDRWYDVVGYQYKPDHFVASFVEITDQKKAETELLANTEDLKESQRIAHVGSWRLDIASNQVIWSEELYRMYGFDPTLPPPPYTEHQKLFTPESWNKLSAAFQNTQNTGNTYDLELETLRADGSPGWMWVYGMPVLDANGITVGLRGMAQDITERKKYEESLRRSESDLAAAQAISHIGSWRVIFGKDGEQWFGSEQLNQIYGYPSGMQLAMETGIDRMHPDDRDLVKEAWSAAMAGTGPLEWQHRIVVNGHIKWVDVRVKFDYDRDGRLIEASGVVEDVTARKKAEEEKQVFEQQLQQTQKLESLGVLAGGIAHDFNNILAIIMGNCSLAKMDAENAGNYIPEIEKASDRAAALCRQMLAYAGKATLAQTQVNMWTLIDEMINMLKATIPQNTVIKPNLSHDISFVTGDASQLRQIAMNLIINASEAIGETQGEIQVSLSKALITKSQSVKDHQGKDIPPGEYVCLEVTDNGCGMDEETKWRIFEPFYTTKFTGRGLGMSAVLGIITAHNGALQLYSQPGLGTTFKVYLPCESAVVEPDKEIVPSSPWQGSGTILLVEDEESIRSVVKSMLEILGFTVIEACDGKEALAVYQQNTTSITLVITDMGLPIMDGYALFRELKKLNPEQRIIISSGFGDTVVTSRIAAEEIAGLVGKPYNFDQLRTVLKSVLHGA